MRELSFPDPGWSKVGASVGKFSTSLLSIFAAAFGEGGCALSSKNSFSHQCFLFVGWLRGFSLKTNFDLLL
jgi:hypothetical protein